MVFKRKKKKEAESAEGAEDAEKEAPEKEEPKPAAEGEEAPAEGGELSEEEAKKKKKKKMIVIAAAGLAVLLLAGGGAAFFLMGGEHKEEGTKKEEGAAEGVENKPVYFDLPQILVNLNTGGKSASFVKTTITLELANAKDVPLVEANLPRIMDNYNTFLREMKASDLYGSAGVYRLREEMLLRANKVLEPVKVKDVLFREILVQ